MPVGWSLGFDIAAKLALRAETWVFLQIRTVFRCPSSKDESVLVSMLGLMPMKIPIHFLRAGGVLGVGL